MFVKEMWGGGVGLWDVKSLALYAKSASDVVPDLATSGWPKQQWGRRGRENGASDALLVLYSYIRAMPAKGRRITYTLSAMFRSAQG